MAKKSNTSKNKYIALAFGIGFILLVLAMIIFVPCPSSPQYNLFRIVISVGVAGVAVMIPGSLEINLNKGIKALGGIGVFVFVYMYDPAQLNMANNCDQFQLTVYVRGGMDKNDRVLTNRGKVTVDLGHDPREEFIGAHGEAHFNEIPAKFKGVGVKIGLLDAPPYVVSYPDSLYVLDGTEVYLHVIPEGLDQITGMVYEGGVGADSATVSVVGASTVTDSQGNFTLSIPPKYQLREQEVTVQKVGYAVWTGTSTPETRQKLHALLKKQ